MILVEKYLFFMKRDNTHPREFGAHFLGLLDLSSPEQVLGALAIDVPVCSVQRLGLVHQTGCFVQLAAVLQNKI